MPIVRVELWAGSKPEVKKNLARALTDVVVENVGCPAQAVTIVFNEIPKENWVIGGQLCSDLYKDVP
jgi:4-oxalocrotonate tautomerase